MADILDLDRASDLVIAAHLVEDLTFSYSVLDITFRSPNPIDPSSNFTFYFYGNVWKVLSGSAQFNMQINAYTVKAYFPSAFDTVVRSIMTSADILDQVDIKPGISYTQQKFDTPIRGDTYAAVFDHLVYQSLEENYKDLKGAICLSLTTQGIICAPWRSIGLVKGPYSGLTDPVKPEVVVLREDKDYLMVHTPKPKVESRVSYYNKLFGNKLIINGNTLAALGKAYTFDLTSYGYKMEDPLVLIRQEVDYKPGNSQPVKQLFAEITDGKRN